MQKAIIAELHKDSRQPLMKIAANIGVSIATVKYHLKILRGKGILLGFRPVLDTHLLGYEHFKVVLELANPSERKKLKEMLRLEPNVVYITDSLGRYDLEFEAEYEHVNSLLVFIERIKKEISLKTFDIIYKNEEILISEMPR